MRPIERAARVLCLSQSGTDCFDDLEPEAQQVALDTVRDVLQSGWQPIETAPKDAGKLLLWVGNRTHGGTRWEPTVGWWCEICEPKWIHGASFGPTHWQPLPEPPSQ